MHLALDIYAVHGWDYWVTWCFVQPTTPGWGVHVQGEMCTECTYTDRINSHEGGCWKVAASVTGYTRWEREYYSTHQYNTCAYRMQHSSLLHKTHQLWPLCWWLGGRGLALLLRGWRVSGNGFNTKASTFYHKATHASTPNAGGH